MLIVDSQVHIWAPDNHLRPRPAPGYELGTPPEIHDQDPLDLPRLLREMGGAGVDAAILVPPMWEGMRNDVAMEAALLYPERFAIMGKLVLQRPDVREQLTSWKQQPGMLGLRVNFQEADRQSLVDGSLDWFWAEAERCGVPIMTLATGLLPYLGVVAGRHPGLRLVVDHFGLTTAFKDDEVNRRVNVLIGLARYPNVAVKASGLPCNSTEAYPFRGLHEAIRRVVEAFGPHRVFWGTDLTRLLRKCSYREAVTMFTEELSFLSDIDKQWIMGRALIEWLGWQQPKLAGS